MPRSTNSMTFAVWAAGLLTLAGLVLGKITEYRPLSGQSDAVGWSFTVVVSAEVAALTALLVAAVPTAWQMLRGRANGAAKLLVIPPLAVMVWFLVLRLGSGLAVHQDVHSARKVLAATLLLAATSGVLAATGWTAIAVFRRIPTHTPRRLRVVLVAVMTAGMAITTIACLVWGLALRSPSYQGLLDTPLVPNWIAVLVLMAGATALAGYATRIETTAAAQ